MIFKSCVNNKPESPPPREIIADRNFEFSGVIFLFVFASYISKLVHGEILVKVGAKANTVAIAIRLQNPDLS